MSLSLNELDALAKKAARGAGHHWGIAEEAGKATRWLCARGLDGGGALARLMDDTCEIGKTRLTPASLIDDWESPSGRICPLIAGTAISDNYRLLASGRLRIVNVSEPLLLLPFAAGAAHRLDVVLGLDWGGGLYATDGSRCTHEVGSDAASDCADTATVVIGPNVLHGVDLARATRAAPDGAALAVLERFAARTYAPATEESRRLGAGAGTGQD